MLDKVESQWLHDEGFKFEKRKFKLFVFSEILEKAIFEKSSKKFIFPEKITFYIASPVNWILEQFAKNSILNNEFYLGSNKVVLRSIEVLKYPVLDKSKILIKTLSPIEVHSTLTSANGKNKTYYYSPKEREFSELINKNLQKKWEAFYKEKCPYNLKIIPLRNYNYRQIILSLKKLVIKGWKGKFILEGDIPLIKFAFDAGLGSRNSLGFGMIDIIKKKIF